MGHSFLHRPEFHINAVWTVFKFVHRRVLAFYPSCNTWGIYKTRRSQVELGLLAELEFTTTAVEVSPAREKFNGARKRTGWIARIPSYVTDISTIEQHDFVPLAVKLEH